MTATIGVAAATAVTAAAQDPAPTPAPTPTPAPEAVAPATVTLRASRSEVQFDGRRSGRVTLRGALAGTRPVGRVRVRLVGRSAAYRRDAVVRTTRTDRSGRFAFRVRPPANAAYRVTILPGQGLRGRSPRRAVAVFPALALSTSARAGKGLRLRYAARAPRRLDFDRGRSRTVRPGSAGEAFFYVRLKGERTYRRAGTADLSDLACRGQECRRDAATVLRKRSLLKRLRNVGACVRGTVFRGFGDPAPCGAARRRF